MSPVDFQIQDHSNLKIPSYIWKTFSKKNRCENKNISSLSTLCSYWISKACSELTSLALFIHSSLFLQSTQWKTEDIFHLTCFLHICIIMQHNFILLFSSTVSSCITYSESGLPLFYSYIQCNIGTFFLYAQKQYISTYIKSLC